MSCSEFSLIEKYFSQQSISRDDVVVSIGDDAAIMQLAPDEQLVVSTDTMVEEVHFPKDTHPFDIGYKLMAVNLSDLASMGAQPRWASLALTLPESNEAWLKEFSKGLFELAKKYSVQLIGGDTTRGPLTLSLTLHGTVTENKYLQRGNAQVGDAIFVSGQLGDAGLALRYLQDKKDVPAIILARLNQPTPRIELGQSLIGIAHAAIDISDGLLADLAHILDASQLGATLQLEALPLSNSVRSSVANGDWSLPLSAGDDYELCFTLPESAIKHLDSQHCLLTRIGTVVSGKGIDCYTPDGKKLEFHDSGYDHFSSVLRKEETL